MPFTERTPFAAAECHLSNPQGSVRKRSRFAEPLSLTNARQSDVANNERDFAPFTGDHTMDLMGLTEIKLPNFG